MTTSTTTLRIPHPTRLPLRIVCLKGDAEVSDLDGVDGGGGFDAGGWGRPAQRRAEASDTRDTDLLFDVLRVVEHFYQLIAEALDDVGLSVTRYEVLQYLDDADGPVTLLRLSEDLGFRLSCVRPLVDRLESAGLLRRIDDPASSVPMIEITPLGSEKADAGAARIDMVQARFAASLADDEPVQLVGLLQRSG